MRLSRELQQITRNPIEGATVNCDIDLYTWKCCMRCMDGSLYEGLSYNLIITFPLDYPYHPPQFRFKTPMLHPNVKPDGIVSISVLESDWSPALTVDKLFLTLQLALVSPELPQKGMSLNILANPDAYELLKFNKYLYRDYVRRWQEGDKIKLDLISLDNNNNI
jgi:ubiquitin-protein ligase